MGISRLRALTAGVLLATIAAMGVSAYAGESEDESEILYAEARIAALEGDRAKALDLATKSFTKSSLNTKAGDLILESATALKRADVLKDYKPKVAAAKKRRAKQELAIRQLEWAQKDMQAGNLDIATRRLRYVENQRGNLGDANGELANESRFRLGMAYMETLDMEMALAHLKSAGRDFGQQTAFLTGNIFSQRGFPGEAFNAYQSASEPSWLNFNPQLALTSKDAADSIGKPRLSLQAYLSYMADSNPFSLPESEVGLSDGTTNRATVASLGAYAAFRVPGRKPHRVAFQVELSGSESRALQRDTRVLLDSRSVSPGILFSYAKYGSGRLALRYNHSLQSTPVSNGTGGYSFRTLLRANEVSAYYSMGLSSRTDLTLSYRIRHSRYYGATDAGIYDRSGLLQSPFLILNRRTPWKLLYPALSLGYSHSNALGGFYNSRIVSGTLSNYMRFGNTSLEGDVSAGYDQANYPGDTAGRIDRTTRLGVSLAYPLVSRRLTLSGQASYSRALSSHPYYLQNRFVLVSTLIFTAF
jgi:hypothetical protein